MFELSRVELYKINIYIFSNFVTDVCSFLNYSKK